MPELEARLVELYKLGQGGYSRLLLSTPTCAASARRRGWSPRSQPRSRADRRASADASRSSTATRATLEERRAQLAALRADARTRAGRGRRAPSQARNALIADIDRRRDLNAQLAGELQARAAEAAGHAARADVGRRRRRRRPPACRFAPFRGDLDWPAAGTVRRRFGERGRRPPASSNGIEIAAAEGAPVHAVHDGTVAFAERFAGFGNLVILDHGAQTFSLYGNLLDIAVHAGPACRAAAGRHGRVCACRARPGCISSCASTVSRSIPYNG